MNWGHSTELERRCPRSTTSAHPYCHRRTHRSKVHSTGRDSSSTRSIFESASPRYARLVMVSRSSSRTFSYSTRLQAADFVKSPSESEESPRALSQVLECELLSRDVEVHCEQPPYQIPTLALQSPGDRMQANPPEATSIGRVSDEQAGDSSMSLRIRSSAPSDGFWVP